jgi:XTP/dITP diphosphohydrolase
VSPTLDRVVLATRNEGKARELSLLLAGLARRFESLRDHPAVVLPPETGRTYLENARLKARAAYGALGVPAIGDDSGLEVDALGGAPGIRSARFAGPGATDAANLARLLDDLKDVPTERRGARFRCVLVLARSDGEESVAEGTCEGAIAPSPRGSRGFGYDPVFVALGETQTFAELTDERKNQLSHRGRAAAALRRSIVGTRLD